MTLIQYYSGYVHRRFFISDKKISQETKIRLIESSLVAISVDNQALNTAINAADFTMKSPYFPEEVKQAAANEMTEKRQTLNRNLAEMQKLRTQLQELQQQEEVFKDKEKVSKQTTSSIWESRRKSFKCKGFTYAVPSNSAILLAIVMHQKIGKGLNFALIFIWRQPALIYLFLSFSSSSLSPL